MPVLHWGYGSAASGRYGVREAKKIKLGENELVRGEYVNNSVVTNRARLFSPYGSPQFYQ